MRSILWKTKLTLMTALILVTAGFFSQPARAQGPITGDITFAGSVSLDTTSVNTATMVTAWHGLAPGDKPQVQSDDGDFAAFVTPGDGTTFHAPWSFNSGPLPAFWSVDGFTFDLTTSHIVQQTGNGFLSVAGTGTVSHTGFTSTPGTFTFTTQDPSANSRFSFSAASAVPEGNTTALIAIGSVSLGCLAFRRKLRQQDL